MVAPTPNPHDVFFLPDLGEGLEDAELVEWCVHVGQRVNENDILAKMETAKALVEIPSPRPGTISALYGKPGQTIKVGSPLVTFRAETARIPQAAPEPQGPAQLAVPLAGRGPAAESPPRRLDAGTVVGSVEQMP